MITWSRLSGGRLTAGLGMGGWPADYAAGGVSLAGRGALFETALATMQRAWQATGGRPRILLGGTVRTSFARATTAVSEGWVAPLFGLALLEEGGAAIRRAWSEAGRPGGPRIVVTGRHFSLGPDADATADAYPPLLRGRLLRLRPCRHTHRPRAATRGAAAVGAGRLRRLPGAQRTAERRI